MKIKKNKIIISGGGTGGHIYPSISVADQLKVVDPNIEILFVGTKRGMESKLVPQAGYSIKFLPIGRFNSNVSLIERIFTLVSLPLVLFMGLFVILKFRPTCVFGVGGYASVPMVYLASKLGIRTITWEPNAMPGMANRVLSKYVNKSLIVFKEAAENLKSSENLIVGVPVRESIQQVSVKEDTKTFNIFVFGGSLGAKAINDCLVEAVLSGETWLSGIKIVHQTGGSHFEGISRAYADCKWANKHLESMAYIDNIEKYYGEADLIISRAGAATVAELAACGRASLLIPFPYASDNHQQKNAEALVSSDSAIMLLQKDLTKESLIKKILELKNNKEYIDKLSHNVKNHFVADSSNQIVNHILNRD